MFGKSAPNRIIFPFALYLYKVDCAPQRMDLGECPNIHDLALRADYELAAKNKDYFYDIDVSSTSDGPEIFIPFVLNLFGYDHLFLFGSYDECLIRKMLLGSNILKA